MSDPFVADLWRFVRGDADRAELEPWIYAHSDELDARLGARAALDVLAADFRSPETVAAVAQALRDYLERVSELECRCITLPRIAVIDMGEESEKVLATIEQRRVRGEPFWWLWCGECGRCGEWWLVGQESRQNDVFCLRRLSDQEATALQENSSWPSDFDTYEALLRFGLEAGKSVRFADPEQARSLRWTIEDLAKARPGIRVSELAALLNLDIDLAVTLSRRAAVEGGVAIVFD